MTFRLGSHIWSACAAGWLVVAAVYQDWLCLAVSIGCMCMAGLFVLVGESLGEK